MVRQGTKVGLYPGNLSEKVGELLQRNVEEVFIREHLEKKLLAGTQLRVKLGFDPTGPKIHIGRAIALWKLKEFQDMGHQIVFVVGDFTAQIGDPSDKLGKRPMLSADEIKRNLATYKEQVGKILDISGTEFRFNSEWLTKISLTKFIELAETFSVQQMSDRRNFKERFARGDEVSLREFLYPLLQGYDSVAVKADVEIGGTDQLFNLKAGRVVQRHYNQPEQDILITKMLLGTDGRKMSTSWGNIITVADEPREMFGKVMSIDDSLMEDYFSLATDANPAELGVVAARLKDRKENPRNVKFALAKKIVSRYCGAYAAGKAAQDFEAVFSEGQPPRDIVEVSVPAGTPLVSVALKYKLIASKSDWGRLVRGGGVSLNTVKVTDSKTKVEEGGMLKIGKRRFLKISI